MNDDEFPDILWRHARKLELHHPSVPQDNAVDPRHFEYTHTMFGKQLEDGAFEADGHKAVGTMATEVLPPLSYASGDRSSVITHFDGPLNDYLIADMGGHASPPLQLRDDPGGQAVQADPDRDRA